MEYETKSKRNLKFLIDTGSNKNYIQPRYIRNPIPNKTSFLANSVGGNILVTHHALINLFDFHDEKLKFFILPNLTTFDGIIGNDTLKQLKAVIHTDENYMTILPDIVIPLKQHVSNSINNLKIRNSHMDPIQKQRLDHLIRACPNLFSDPDKKLTYTSVVKGEIRTTTNEPVYSKSYPYPMCLKNIVEKEIEALLKDGIIRPSRSPYNSPVWIVPKKTDASGEKKYRMVIDYRKLNKITTSDKYPIPEINEVLSNLGNNKWFTIIDLKSGFHQIPLKTTDIEKTAFSVNNGKYEFTRLPFGLKNAPAIFQRTLDDILREHIGKRCYVYIDDIIIFGKTQDEHVLNLQLVFKTLEHANMKIQLDKCEFFQHEVEFLGFIISREGIRTNQKKVQAIADLTIPKTLRELRSFLGMSGYYRRFILGYAHLAKPLTSLLRGEDGRTSKSTSKNKIIQLNQAAIEAFHKIKNTLISKEVLLSYPDFEKDFELTTDASNYAIGAVLSQNNRPITFLSRTLNKTEESYAANEKEMLAIIWALNSLRNFLYGARKVIIFTDHQPLTGALSNKNTNSKMKRWKATLEEYNHELRYKPGKANVVADSLSRPPVVTQINSMTPTQHSSESSPQNLIPTVEVPVNVFRNQIIIKTGEDTNYQLSNPFPNFCRHVITQKDYSENDLVNIFKNYLNPHTINGLMTTEKLMGTIQEIYPVHFNDFKIRFTQTLVEDLVDETDQQEKMITIHQRAHRNSQENRKQLLEKYYFPRMNRKMNLFVKQCMVCKENKYDRRPNNQFLQTTPIPNFPGHTLHIDIYSTEKNLVLTAIDKFTKLAQAKIIKTRSIEDIKRPLRDLLFLFNVPENVVIDNEKSLNSASIKSMMQDELKIKIFTVPPYKSEVNGQIERFHSTLSEIMRCLKSENPNRTFEELLERSVNEYNFTIHSVTGKKPVELFYGRTPHITPKEFENARLSNIEKLRQKQDRNLDYHNKNRKPVKDYEPGQIIFVKHNVRLGSKLTRRFDKEIVRENKNTTVITETGRTIHKTNIRN